MIRIEISNAARSRGTRALAVRLRGWLSIVAVLAGAHAWNSAHAEMANVLAVNCSFSNKEVSPWRELTPLTQSTPVGSILYRRQINLFTSYQFGSLVTAPQELVLGGHWSLQGGAVTNGVAQTNVDGIGLKWASIGSDGVKRPVAQGGRPTAFAKIDVKRDTGATVPGDTMATQYLQYLVLTKPASQLPQGDLVVSDLPANPVLALYAVDLPKGTASLGSIFDMPTSATPPNLCKSPINYIGAGNINIDGGGAVTVPNKCDVVSDSIVPVELGNFAVSQFGALNATSAPVDFSISLSNCAASAKPTISFRDKAAQPNADKTLLQLSAPAGRAVAQGFNIVMTNASTGERIAYGDPGSAKQYSMKRVGDMATIPLRAQYIRTGIDAELKPGYAGGAAEFTFTFP
ncbi:fimbrial protein [Burkholderia stagnalis]|uniref:fimbrial protein n=1 Tax=Burkholderia stagnalis TaxID=1503054 RepID=UPI001E2EFDB8|nr:fimbrial protein [Burkholderia stagnalis]